MAGTVDRMYERFFFKFLHLFFFMFSISTPAQSAAGDETNVEGGIGGVS